MTELLPQVVPALAMALLHFLWQGAAVGALAWLSLSLLRRARPQARYAVACAALLLCVLLPAWSLAHALAGMARDALPQGAPALDAGIDTMPLVWLRDAGQASALSPALSWIVALWAAGACLLLLRMACGLAWLHRLQAGAHADGRWQACVDRLALRLRVGRRVALRVVDAGDSPVCAGWWRPVVLLPAAIAARMPAELLEALLAHELAHVRRHDYLVNLLQGAVEALLFYHPVVWWLSRRIRIERELVADDLAAAELGDPRRLAVALAELDRFDPSPVPVHSPLFAHAARGGHLMSRIQQLVRPDRRAASGALVLPLIALAAAGAVFHAHARLADASSMVIEQHVAAATPRPAPASAAAGVARPAAQPSASASARAAIVRRGDDDGYALVRKDSEGFAISGTLDDVDAVRAARDAIDADFIWFRRDGKAWVLRDADALSRARAAWKDTDALDLKMRALDAHMRPHSERMQALGERMEALARESDVESPEMREASRRIEAVSRQIQAAAQQQAALAVQQMQPDLGEARQRQLENEMDEQQAKMEALERQLEVQTAAIDAASERMQARQQPMEALGREMEAAGKPMEAISKEMEAIGDQIERTAAIAETEIRRIIDDAYARGLATQAPSAQ